MRAAARKFLGAGRGECEEDLWNIKQTMGAFQWIEWMMNERMNEWISELVNEWKSIEIIRRYKTIGNSYICIFIKVILKTHTYYKQPKAKAVLVLTLSAGEVKGLKPVKLKNSLIMIVCCKGWIVLSFSQRNADLVRSDLPAERRLG